MSLFSLRALQSPRDLTLEPLMKRPYRNRQVRHDSLDGPRDHGGRVESEKTVVQQDRLRLEATGSWRLGNGSYIF